MAGSTAQLLPWPIVGVDHSQTARVPVIQENGLALLTTQVFAGGLLCFLHELIATHDLLSGSAAEMSSVIERLVVHMPR
jgi:hypothetical protein